ncbi:MAG: hypothetical protein GF320_13375 [Armatimonadia bacterium]|nr:hypothetical protein [Armatimonadia bacterium]
MASKDKIRVGFIGAGGIARGHFRRTNDDPRAEVAALCDIRDEPIERLIEANPDAKECPVYKDWREMLDKEQLDGVQILTPHTIHFEESMEALDRGLHVLSEKPMVCRVDHAKELIKKIEESGKVFSLAYQRHQQAEFRYIRERLQSGDMGDIHYVQAFQAQGWYRGTAGTWRQVPEESGGGQLNDSGSHLVDIIFWTTGLVPESVFAFIENLESDVDILTAASVRFTSGAVGTFSVIGHAPGWWEDITWFCDKGALYMRNGKLLEMNSKGETVEPTDLPSGSDPDTHWIDVILGEAENEATALNGLRVIQFTEAAWLSGDSGQPSEVVFD